MIGYENGTKSSVNNAYRNSLAEWATKMSTELREHPYASIIWDLLMASIENKFGVSGLMGNLQAESGLYPDRKQGDVPYSSASAEYTALVDSGEISAESFANDSIGYGLAQWTTSDRKAGLLSMKKSGDYNSVGDVALGCAYLLHELETSYANVLDVLKTATDIRTASDAVLHDFERPADQSESVEIARYELGVEIYNTFSANGGGGGGTGSTTRKRKGLSKLLLYCIITDDF